MRFPSVVTVHCRTQAVLSSDKSVDYGRTPRKYAGVRTMQPAGLRSHRGAQRRQASRRSGAPISPGAPKRRAPLRGPLVVEPVGIRAKPPAGRRHSYTSILPIAINSSVNPMSETAAMPAMVQTRNNASTKIFLCWACSSFLRDRSRQGNS